MTIEQTYREIISDVRAAAQAGTLDAKSLAVAIAATQDFIEYLERLEVAPLQISDIGIAGGAAAETITGVWNYGS